VSDEGVFLVSELCREVAGALHHRFPDEVWVEGELHGLKRSPRGHVYFDLVEPGDLGAPPVASLAVALFDQARRAVNALLRRSGGVRMTDGMAIRIRASVDFYAPQGQLRLRMTGIDPNYTLGRLAADRDRVLRALATEGLLDRNRARPHPVVPLAVGVVTAADSAALADFVHELARSRYQFRILHADARMQGPLAERSIIAALRTLETQAEVIALVRGGGGRTDLATFDSEAIARTIATLRVPVHTGIGHETDRSVADEVAHDAHKTPTACAAALVAVVDRYLGGLDERARAIATATDRGLTGAKVALHSRVAATTHSARQVLDHHRWRLEVGSGRLVDQVPRRLRDRDAEVARVGVQVGVGARGALDRAERAVDLSSARHEGLDPIRLLERGWTITRRVDGGRVRAADLVPGVELVTIVADGQVRSTVTSTAPSTLAADASDREETR
jgi:exodeoxyribonuclease VII large subunit